MRASGAALAQLQHVQDSCGVEAEAQCQLVNDGAAIVRDRFAHGPKGVAKQDEERGRGLDHQEANSGVAARRDEILLPQTDQVGTQFAFHLFAMQAHGHAHARENIFAKEQTVLLLNVEQLDGKNVRSVLQLLEPENEGRGMTFFLPPARGGAELLQFGAVEAVGGGQDVQVGMLRLKIACSRRAVENNGLQIRSDRRFQPFDKLCQIFFHEFLSVRLPTSARATATRRAAAKSAEATAATESASAPASTT